MHTHRQFYHVSLDLVPLRLWYFADSDLLSGKASYRLCNTGQGLNRYALAEESFLYSCECRSGCNYPQNAHGFIGSFVRVRHCQYVIHTAVCGVVVLFVCTGFKTVLRSARRCTAFSG